MGHVFVNGVPAEEGDIIGIYVGGELRGKQKVQYFSDNAWLGNARVGSSADEELAAFKLYDKSLDMLLESDSNLIIKPGITVGELLNPFIININYLFADAGEGQVVNGGTVVTLDGSRSSAPNSNELSYMWLAPDGVVLSSSKVIKPTFIAPEVDEDTVYTFKLTVTSGDFVSKQSSVEILIRKNKIDTDTLNLFDVKYNPFGFSFEAKESENYIIEVTQDFKLWNQLDAYSNSNGIIKFEDKRTPQVPYLKSFYRVKLLR